MACLSFAFASPYSAGRRSASVVGNRYISMAVSACSMSSSSISVTTSALMEPTPEGTSGILSVSGISTHTFWNSFSMMGYNSCTTIFTTLSEYTFFSTSSATACRSSPSISPVSEAVTV